MSEASSSTGLADFIASNVEPILQDWEDFARSLVPLAGLDQVALRDHAEAMLLGVVQNMRAPQSEHERREKAKGSEQDDALTEAAEDHALARLDDNFTLNQVTAEFRAIRASVLRHWMRALPDTRADVDDVMRFNEAIDQAVTASIARYSDKLDESRAVILGVLAHDLRNPLSAISVGMQYILRADSADAATMKVAVRAQQSVQRMDGLVRDLLDFTRVRMGAGLPMRVEHVDMGALFMRTVDEVQAAHPQRRIRIDARGAFVGQWDPGRLSQMLVNLVANALHHGSPGGEVRVTLKAGAAAVTLAVHNFGPAMSASAREGMFQPLNRATLDGRGMPAESSGLGLGLYIAHQIVTAHQGTLEVTSTEGEGTTFTARLPRQPKAH